MHTQYKDCGLTVGRLIHEINKNYRKYRQLRAELNYRTQWEISSVLSNIVITHSKEKLKIKSPGFSRLHSLFCKS